MALDTTDDLRERIRELQNRLNEAEETLQALRSGEVDAVVAAGPDGDRVYTLRGADEAYRVMVQGMAEGALTLTADGLILFSNEQFATILGTPLERVIGSRIQDFVAAEDADAVGALLSGREGRKAEARLRSADAASIPVYLSVENVFLDGVECLCLIVTDLSEQKRNEEMVAAEKLARSILEQAAEAILVVDPEGRIIRASRTAEHLAGAAVVQRRFDEVFRIRLGSGAEYPFPEILAGARRGQPINNVDATAVAADGRKFELLLSAAALSSPASGLLGCVLHLTDISERKRREQQLKFQADILETTAEAVIAIDPSHRVTFWNSGAERMYGLSRDEALGKRPTDLYRYAWLNPEDEQQAQAALEKHGMWSGENIHIRRDETELFVGSTVNAIGPEHGGGTFAVIRDITERKKAEAILRESEARERSRAAELQAIMEAVPAAVSIARDPECRNIVGNRMAYQMLRVPYASNFSKSAPEEQKPRSFREVKDGRDLPPEELPMQIAARTGQPVHNYELDLVFDDETSLCWLGNAEPLFDEAGRSRGAVGVFVDITERKHSEERLRQSQKLESIGLLAGGIAHDFNNLLVGVIGNASLARDTLPPGDPAVELVQGVIETGEQLATLTRQMLAYAGKGRFFIERLNLSEVIPHMSGLVQPSISKKITVHFDLERELPSVEADRGQIQQVVMNLLLNAAEAIGANAGLISVRTGVREVNEQDIRRNPEAAELVCGRYVYLEVRDTGCGIDPETKAKIFDPFFTTKFTGRGLGLAAVSGIVRGHKGWIEVRSTPGTGSYFTVMLPAVEAAPVPAPVVENVGTGVGTGTVLVVDDEPMVREMARRALTRRGFDVLVAAGSLEAMDICKRHPGEIALILLDLSMPDMGGEEALPALRKIRPGVKVVVSSGYSEAETLALFEGQRVSGFLQKPYTPSRLAEMLKGALG